MKYDLVAKLQATLPVEARLAHMTSYVPKCPLLTTMELSNFFSKQSQGLFPICVGYKAVFLFLVIMVM
jgi:hypothetical protein